MFNRSHMANDINIYGFFCTCIEESRTNCSITQNGNVLFTLNCLPNVLRWKLWTDFKFSLKWTRSQQFRHSISMNFSISEIHHPNIEYKCGWKHSITAIRTEHFAAPYESIWFESKQHNKQTHLPYAWNSNVDIYNRTRTAYRTSFVIRIIFNDK